MASPTFYRLHAAFRGAAAHAGIRPEAGRSAIVAAAKAIAAMPHGRIDEETTANVGTIAGGAGGTNVVAEHCWFDAEARSLSDAAVESARGRDGRPLPRRRQRPAVRVRRRRHRRARVQRPTATGPRRRGVVAAEAALRACDYTPRRILSGGGSDANAFEANGPALHQPRQRHRAQPRVRPSASARSRLEGMLDVTFALLDELAEG